MTRMTRARVRLPGAPLAMAEFEVSHLLGARHAGDPAAARRAFPAPRVLDHRASPNRGGSRLAITPTTGGSPANSA
jgi:hypothetical protein